MSSNRKLVATLACRNQGSRLYGKPAQNLDVASRTRIIDNIIRCLQSIEIIDEIVLAISFGSENEIFKQIASEHDLKFIVGDEDDVLSRLISAAECGQATDVFRVTSESPFLYFEAAKYCWETYNSNELDALFLEPIIDGCGFEIISLEALKRSHREGSLKHRSEMCSLYIRENADSFKIARIAPPSHLQRFDLRLTVDNPEDLVVCRHIYEAFKSHAPRIALDEIVKFLDRNPELIKLTSPFTESGYKTMFL
jgi:spore coat polysaccharide biosynthesis protein SpsF